jgi:hypothetical protein
MCVVASSVATCTVGDDWFCSGVVGRWGEGVCRGVHGKHVLRGGDPEVAVDDDDD